MPRLSLSRYRRSVLRFVAPGISYACDPSRPTTCRIFFLSVLACLFLFSLSFLSLLIPPHLDDLNRDIPYRNTKKKTISSSLFFPYSTIFAQLIRPFLTTFSQPGLAHRVPSLTAQSSNQSKLPTVFTFFFRGILLWDFFFLSSPPSPTLRLSISSSVPPPYYPVTV